MKQGKDLNTPLINLESVKIHLVENPISIFSFLFKHKNISIHVAYINIYVTLIN